MVSSRILLVVLVLHIHSSVTSKGNNTVTKEKVEEKAISGYRSACLRLHNMAHWMSILFKLKTAWTNSTTAYMMMRHSQLLGSDKVYTGGGSLPSFTRRLEFKSDGSDCSSLQSFYHTLQTYVHYQAQLIQLKAVLGKILLKTGQMKFDEASVMLRDRIAKLDVLNKTSIEIFENLKLSSRFLPTQYADKAQNLEIKSIQSSPKFLAQLQSQSSKIEEQVQEITERQQIRSLFQTGDFFQNVGKMLDKLLL